MLMRPDKSFYPSPRLAMQAPKEKYGYLVIINPLERQKPDALVCVDLDPESSTYGQILGRVDMPNIGDELHHFGWNACSSALCPNTPHPHVERRYLIVPGVRSSRLYILDTKENPYEPKIIKTIEADELANKSGYSSCHTVHCGPAGIYVSALGNAKGDAPGGILMLDHDSFDVLGQWEVVRGPQEFAYDFWWNLCYDVIVTSEWGTPNMIMEGVNPEILLAGGYGHHLNFWNLPKRKHIKAIDLGSEQQMVLEIRPAHDPSKPYGFVGVVLSLKDLSSSVWMWYLDNGEWKAKKVIEIPAQPADPDQLPPLLKDFKAVPPLITDINLSLDDKYLFVSCWGTGEFHQYDVSDPHNAKLMNTIKLGGITHHAAHPSAPEIALNGGPQMMESSLDGKRVYVTNSLYTTWDQQFYPAGIKGWMVKFDVGDDGQLRLDPDFFIDFKDERPHQLRLNGGDSSSDSYCYS